MGDSTLKNRQKAEFLEDFYEMLSKEIIIAYRGTFEKTVLGVLAQNIGTSIDSSSVLRGKFLKLFLELSQNISEHSTEVVKSSNGEISGSGLLIIKYKGEDYLFITGNLIRKDNFENVDKTVNHINSMNRDELREYKREQIEKAEVGKKNCLGLIQIALISGHDLQVKCIEHDKDQLFLILSVELAKNA